MKKTILVTGASGFIGEELCKKLKSDGYNVIGLSRSDGDIAEKLPTVGGIDHIIHLAGRVYVPDSWEDPVGFYRANVLGTANILWLCKEKKCGLTFISSYVYGAPRFLPIGEDHPIDPVNPYCHSKILAEDLCRFFHKNFAIPVSILRPFNVYGVGQREDFVIPAILKQAMEERYDIIRMSDLRPKRDYIHVRDLVDAIVATMGKKGLSTYNVGSGRSFSVEEIIKEVLRLTGVSKQYESAKKIRKNEINNTVADISRIRKELGWEPKISMTDGITEMINSLRE